MTPDGEVPTPDADHHVVGRDDRITLRFMSTPADTAAGGGSITAGSVMEWIDKAAYACAVGWAGTYCVTAYVGNVHHARRIEPGSLIEVQARIIHTGRTSMHVGVVVSSSELGGRSYESATTCILIFVAKGSDGRPAPVVPWQPSSAADRELAAAALSRIEPRLQIKRAMTEQTYTPAGKAPRAVLRFLVPPGVVNWGGNAHGGTVMRWIDEAAYACAAAWSGDDDGGGPRGASAAVGVYSGGIHFLHPVRIGDLVEITARLIYTSERSMHMSIRVSSADPRTPTALELTTRCMSVFVVPDASGRAQPVPPWRPVEDEDVRLEAHARELITLRAAMTPIPAVLTLQP